MEARAHLSWSKHTFQTAIFVVIAFIAVLIAAIGIYGVTAFAVASRTREIGVRMALGANNRQIARATMGPRLRFALSGAGLGIVGALLLGRIMRATLCERSPVDPASLAGAVFVLMVAAIAATSLPLRRALRVDPVDVLRSE
jgi:ABC-type antimicrobial peptide transport system permease subunit